MTHYAVVHDRDIPFSSSAFQPGKAAAEPDTLTASADVALAPSVDLGALSTASAAGTVLTTDAPSALLHGSSAAGGPHLILSGQQPHLAGGAADAEDACEGTPDACQAHTETAEQGWSTGVAPRKQQGQVGAQAAQADPSGAGRASTAGAGGADFGESSQLSVMAVPLSGSNIPAQQGSAAAPAGASISGQGSGPANLPEAGCGVRPQDKPTADRHAGTGQPADPHKPASSAAQNGQSTSPRPPADGAAAPAQHPAQQPNGTHAAMAGAQPEAVDAGMPAHLQPVSQETSAGRAPHSTNPLPLPVAVKGESASSATASLPSLQEAHKDQPTLPVMQQPSEAPISMAQPAAVSPSFEQQPSQKPTAADSIEAAAAEHQYGAGASSAGDAQQGQEGGQLSAAVGGSQDSNRPSTEELKALAEEVARLERELEQALIAARSGNREVSAAQAEAAQWREREADARAEVSHQGCCSRQLHSHGRRHSYDL